MMKPGEIYECLYDYPIEIYYYPGLSKGSMFTVVKVSKILDDNRFSAFYVLCFSTGKILHLRPLNSQLDMFFKKIEP